MRIMKKLLLLGGSRYILPVIKKAHDLGIFVITCDYLPNNIAHKYSDKYCNVSIIEKDAVLKIAEENKIDGVMSFACDPGVVTAAYVAEKMNLPFQASYKSAQILQDKGLFRKFLEDNGFNVPHSKRYLDKKKPFDDLDYFNWPVIVKPVDSAGSKGVKRVDTPECLAEAIDKAIESSLNGAFIIEDYITFDGYHSSADPFIIDGKIQFMTYSDQLFDKEAANPYTPTKIIWPSSMEINHQNYLTHEIQRLIDLLGLTTGIYNIETCVGIDGKPYIMEVSPRGGGCKIAELEEMAFGVNLIENEVRKAVGLPLLEIKQTKCNGHWCEMVIHPTHNQSGIFDEISIDENIQKNYLNMLDLCVSKGIRVMPFTGANMSLGDMFLQFNSREKLDDITNHLDDWLKIKLL